MANDWATITRTTEYQASVEFALAETPGKFIGDGVDQGGKKGSMIQLIDYFSGLTMQPIKGRNAQTEHADPDVARRWLGKPPRAGVAVLLDPDDELETSVDIKSPLPKAVALAARKYQDDQFLTGFYSANYTGSMDALVQTPFKAANILAADVDTPGTPGGLTVEKLILLQQMMTERFVDTEAGLPTIVIDGSAAAQLMRLEKYVNGDYNNTKALAEGKLVSFMGFNWKRAEITNAKAYPNASKLAVNGAGHTRLPVYLPGRTMAVNKWLDFKGYDDELPDMNHSEQFAGYSCVGAARLDEDLAFILEVKR